MRHLDPVVEVAALPVLHTGQEVALGGGVALHLVRDHHARHVLQTTQQLAEEPHGTLAVAPALDRDVEHVSILVDRTSETMSLAWNADEDLMLSANSGGCW